MDDRELIKICLREVTLKSGYADTASLRQRDLEHISAEIEKSTGILISISTIKRLLNGQFNHLPQAATLNAITAYLGYGSWQEFRKIKQQEVRPHTVQFVSSAPNKKKRIPVRILITGTGIVLFLMIVSLTFFSTRGVVNDKDVLFSVKKITRSDIPNTVVFSYDVEKADGDSFFIQQSWDRDRRVKIDKHKHTLTDIYYEPGYHNAKLFVNDKVVKTVDVSIPTNGWFFFSKPGLFRGLPAYINAAEPVKSGALALSREDIVSSRVDPEVGNFYYYTLFPDSCDVSMDNFRLKARIRFKQVNNVACPIVVHEVCGQSNSIYFYTTLPGCTGNIDLNVGEHFLSGKTTDLSGFGCDILQWQDMEVVVKNKEAKFYINKREVYNKTYEKSPGFITGLAFMSNGICEIDEIALAGLDGKVVYANSFK